MLLPHHGLQEAFSESENNRFDIQLDRFNRCLPEQPKGAMANKAVLIVGDNTQNLELLTAMMQAEG